MRERRQSTGAPGSALAILPRTVVVLGAASFLNDAASEMITPLLPIFLTASLGAGPTIVGLIEGVAEATASVLKLISGRLADRGWSARKLVIGGYCTSNAARPLIGFALGWIWVLVLRFLDRVGKGIRTAPRDAMLAGASSASMRGRAFGFQRSMDHAGAVVGPLVAFSLLAHNVPLAQVFLWSIVPGLLVVLLLLRGLPTHPPLRGMTAADRFRWSGLDVRLRAMIVVAGMLAFASVPEAFVVLWAHDVGLTVTYVPLLWAAASLAKSLIAWPAGALADRCGRIPVLVGGWLLRVGVLLALAWVPANGATIWLLFLGYAAVLALTEPAERSLVGDQAEPQQRGSAFGLYHFTSGLLALPGALLFGALWELVGPAFAFTLAAGITLLAAAAMLAVITASKRDGSRAPR